MSEERDRRLEEFACGWDTENYQLVEDIRSLLADYRVAQEARRNMQAAFDSSQVLVAANYERAERAEAENEALRAFTPTAEKINALPPALRQYIHALETRCDPAGDLRALVLTRDENALLRAGLSCALDDLAALLRALGESDVARPETPHHVMLACVDKVKALRAERDRLRAWIKADPNQWVQRGDVAYVVGEAALASGEESRAEEVK